MINYYRRNTRCSFKRWYRAHKRQKIPRKRERVIIVIQQRKILIASTNRCTKQHLWIGFEGEMCLSAISSSGLNLIIVFMLFIEPCVRQFHSRPSHQQSKRAQREVEESKKSFQLVRVVFADKQRKSAFTDLICRHLARPVTWLFWSFM
jgi:hypothetical protein